MKRALLLLACIGCSNARGAPDAGAIDAGPESFASQYARAVCDSIEGCCTKNHFKLDHASCLPVVAGEREQRDDGRTPDPDRAAACLTEIRSTFQACPTNDWEPAQQRVLDACNLWPAKVDAGAFCKSASECPTAGCDWVTCDVWCTCHHTPTLGSHCTESLDCPRDPIFLRRFTLFHSPDSAELDAKWDRYCDVAVDGGTCLPTSPLGASCDPMTAIGFYVPSCGGVSCDDVTKTCTHAPLGGSCGTKNTREPKCGADAYCDYPSNTCQPSRMVGEDCPFSITGHGCASALCDRDLRLDGGMGRCLASPFAPFYVCGAL